LEGLGCRVYVSWLQRISAPLLKKCASQREQGRRFLRLGTINALEIFGQLLRKYSSRQDAYLLEALVGAAVRCKEPELLILMETNA